MSSTKRRLPRARVIAAFTVLAALVAVVGYGYFSLGLRAYVVETPSMGTYAPVGTFVVSKPLAAAPEVGQTILFQPEAKSAKTYFHRILSVSASGVSTAGDLTHEQDPWLVQPKNIIGVEAFHVANLGWLLKAAPIVVIGLVLLWIYLRFFSSKFWRVPATLFGISSIFSVANYVLHPFVQATLLDKSTAGGIATIRFVNTGILPLDVKVGSKVEMLSQGQLFVGHAKISQGGNFSITSLPHVEWWSLVLFGLIALAPTVVSIVYAIRQHASGNDWVYVPVKAGKVPEGALVNQSDQLSIDGKLYPKYITADYEAEPYWLNDVENLTTEQLAERLLAKR